jgi:hypothetical protein
MNISVKPLREGGFVVSQNQCWVDGVYDTEAAARLGAKCKPDKLAEIWKRRLEDDRDGFLTVEDFK